MPPVDAERDGISIGEAAAFALLERAPATHRPHCSASANRATRITCRRRIRRARARGGDAGGARRGALAPGAIDYVNLHGTGTPSNDAAEDLAVFGVFGDAVPVSSTKGMTGHTLGAAGAVEAVIAVLAIEEGRIPGSPGTRADPVLRARYVVNGGAATSRA